MLETHDEWADLANTSSVRFVAMATHLDGAGAGAGASEFKM
jgi:hypothetical protein